MEEKMTVYEVTQLSKPFLPPKKPAAEAFHYNQSKADTNSVCK